MLSEPFRGSFQILVKTPSSILSAFHSRHPLDLLQSDSLVWPLKPYICSAKSDNGSVSKNKCRYLSLETNQKVHGRVLQSPIPHYLRKDHLRISPEHASRPRITHISDQERTTYSDHLVRCSVDHLVKFQNETRWRISARARLLHSIFRRVAATGFHGNGVVGGHLVALDSYRKSGFRKEFDYSERFCLCSPSGLPTFFDRDFRAELYCISRKRGESSARMKTNYQSNI